MADPTAEVLLDELGALFEPLANAAENEDHLAHLLEAVGQNLDDLSQSERQQLSSGLDDATTAIEALEDMASQPPDSLDVLGVLGSTIDAFTAIQSISDALSGIDVSDVGEALIDHLVLLYLDSEHPILFRSAVLLSVVRLPDAHAEDLATDVPADYLPYVMQEAGDFDPSLVGDLLSEPVETLQDYYLPDGQLTPEAADRVAVIFFPQLADLLGSLGFDVGYAFDSDRIENFQGVQGLTRSSNVLTGNWPTDDGAFAVHVALASYEGRLALVVDQQGSAEVEFEADRWKVLLGATGDFEVFVVDRTGVVTASEVGGDATSLGVSAGIERLPPADAGDGPVYRIGKSGGTNLAFGGLGAEGSLDAVPDSGTVEGNVLVSAKDASLTVSPGDGDSFIQKVFPDEGIGVDFDAGIGWGTERGLYFQGGGAGLKTELPVNVNIADVLQVETLQLAAQPDLSGESVTIPVHVAADPQVSLGPIDAVVEGIGLKADLSFPENRDGNLGPLAVDLKFKPPTGAGMSVDAGVVTGGGYMEFDHEKQRYAGVLQLKVGELTITAVGLLTTQLPGGRDGFSLLLIISGEFPPVQLGFGFTLLGVGGLLGINRSMDVEYLIAGVSDGTVSSIMFPEDPVRNAPQIISDLRNGFPVAAGNHVFGPMGKLGWGTPTMMSASIGVLFELPDPIRIAILGRVHAGLPHEEVGIVVFNMDVVGAVDFGEKIGAAAASLYDSRVLAYTLTGDMAMKTGWGDDPTFVLSVGGFNPRFEPPPDFPELRRIALTLGPGNPRIRWSGYFAVTSNTVQVGARVEVYAAAAGFSFEGKMGFDVLFRFEPFELVADFYAGFALSRGGSKIMSIDLDGTLKGPGPWHVSGKASFEIWPISFDVSVDEEFGQSESAEELSPADVFGKVAAALGDERNWSAQRPKGGDSMVTLRQAATNEDGGDTVLAHPLGRLSVRQQVAPLGVRIEKYGNGSPATYDRFTVASVLRDLPDGEDGEGLDDGATNEQFAPAEYFELSDDEKIEGPEFESYEAGRQVDTPGFGFGGLDDDSLLARDVLDYETAVIDEEAAFDPVRIERIAMPQSTARELASVSAVSRGPLRTTGEARYEAGDETGPTGIAAAVSVSETAFVVARTADMTRVELDGVPEEGTTRREAKQALAAHLEATGGDTDDYQVVGIHEVADEEGDQ